MDDSRVQDFVDDARRDPEVLAVMLFGSSARQEAHAASDVDVCLVLNGGRDRLPSRLSEIKVGYLARHRLDIQIFQQLPLYVCRRVLKEGKVLWVRDDEALYELALRTARAFEDFRPRYEDYLRSVERARS